MCGVVFGELGVLIGLAEKFATIAGKTQRVGEMQELLDDLESKLAEPGCEIGDQVLSAMPNVNKDREVIGSGMYLQAAWPEAGGVHIFGDGTPHDPNAKIAMKVWSELLIGDASCLPNR